MKNKKIKIFMLSALLLIICTFLDAADRTVLVHNTRQEIAAVKDKLKLKLVRVWGGDEEEDEHKFFKSPQYVTVSPDGLVHICDSRKHQIKVFDSTGAYVRTIGQKGQGPGDLYRPTYMTFTPSGDLAVYDLGNRRIQYFDQKGKSTNILKMDEWVAWMGFDSKNQLLAYQFFKTFHLRKLLFAYNDKGENIGTFGTFRDNADDPMKAGRRLFAIDASSNIYVANVNAPVIRKFDQEGKLLMAVTFEPPFDIPVKVAMDKQGADVKIIGRWPERQYQKTGNGKSKTVQAAGKRGKIALCAHLVIDSKNRIYIIAKTRVRTMKELKNLPSVISSRKYFKVLNKDKISSVKFDSSRLLVFSPSGEVIADSALNTFSHNLFISGSRLFVADGFYNLRIMEYKISIDEPKPGEKSL